MYKELYINIRKLDGGYVLDTEEGSKIYISQQKMLAEIKRVLSQDLDDPLNKDD